MRAVGVLGIGRMGASMARALAAAGFEVVLWNRTPAAAAVLAAELGGRAVPRPADVAAATDVCISMLADGPAVDAVYLGPEGLLSGARPGNVLVDSSTVPPSTIRGFERAARAAGAGILDAPVSGSVTLAQSGTLTIMVGGRADDLDHARPVLSALSATMFHLGPLGSGAAMKLAVNAVIFGLNQALAEGLVLAEAAGIERAAFLEPEATPVAFALALAAKDLRLISALADELGVSIPQVATNLAVITAAATNGRGDRDFSAVAEHLRGSARAKEGEPA